MSAELKYRPEIDGLRALAVIPVIIFHLNPDLLRGGFLGVDVFFVISGFLITSIIYRQVREDRFSLWAFWKRRFKRLYPALACVVIASLAIGLVVLPHPERGALPKQGLAALFSISNIYLWDTTMGYWSSASENISLLHTWSLSLEEQFYICFPVLLYFGHRVCKKHVGKLVAILCALSFVACVVYTDQDRSAAFYFLPTRMWELLIGSLLAIYGSPFHKTRDSVKVSTLLQLAGAGLIAFSYLSIQNDLRFPGYLPIYTCLGTYLLLAVRCERSLITRALSTRPFVYIGKISYSLYLWHWPLIVYAYYITPFPSLPLVIIATFGISMLSYHLIEQPIRSAQRLPRLPALATPCIAVSLIAGFFVFPTSPLLKDLPGFDETRAMSCGWEYEATDKILDPNYASTSIDSDKKIVVVGSSHARVLCRPFERYAQEHHYGFEALATSGYGISRIDNGPSLTGNLNDTRFQIINEIEPDILIVAGWWSAEVLDRDGRASLRQRLRDSATCCGMVIVIGQVPMIDLPEAYSGAMRKYVVANHLSGRPVALQSDQDVRKANAIVKQIVEEIADHRVCFVDPTSALTTSDGYVKVFEGENFIYSDFHHVNDDGAKLLFDTTISPVLQSHQADAGRTPQQDKLPSVSSGLE